MSEGPQWVGRVSWDVCKVSGGCLEVVWMVSETCPEGVRRMSGGCLEGVWKVSGWCPRIVGVLAM